MWFKPHRVMPGQDPPNRAQELKRISQGKLAKKSSTRERWAQSERKIRETYLPNSAFLRLEQDLGGRMGLLARFEDALAGLPQGGTDLSFEDLCCEMLGEWSNQLNTVADLALMRLMVSSTVLQLKHRDEGGTSSVPTGTTPRKIVRKRRPPAWYTLKQEQAQAILQEPARMRKKYWQTKDKGVVDGAFKCNFPSYTCSYDSKAGLAHHKRISHEEGTYTAEGFNCPKCVRSFETETR